MSEIFLFLSIFGKPTTSHLVKEKFTVGEDPLNDFILSGVESHVLFEKIDGIWNLNPGPFSVKNPQSLEFGPLTITWKETSKEAFSIKKASFDPALLGYFLGTGLLALGFFGLSSLVPEQALMISDVASYEDPRYARFFYQADIQKKEEHSVPLEDKFSETRNSREPEISESSGPSSPSSGKKGTIRSSKGIPSLSRDWNPDLEARNAGILGILASQGSSFLSEGSMSAFSSTSEDGDIWGSVTGTNLGEEGPYGLLSSGKFGGGTANGVEGYSKPGLLNPEGIPHGSTTGFSEKKKKVPPMVSVGKIESSGLDKDVVRRVIRSRINEVRSCYNKALVNNPTLEGRVVVQFTILSTGKVSGALITEDTTKVVGPCLSTTIKRWVFPSSKGISIVTYPFKLSTN